MVNLMFSLPHALGGERSSSREIEAEESTGSGLVVLRVIVDVVLRTAAGINSGGIVEA